MLENDTSATAIGKRLRYVRKLADLSREQLAKLADVSPTSISYWEHANEESSSKMTLRSMEKVLKALRENGVECVESWLRTGVGPRPHLVEETQDDGNTLLASEALSVQLITHMGAEIKRFTALSDLAVITKVDSNSMYPALRQGDIVGGIWQDSSVLESEAICILSLNGRLQVRRVLPTSNGLFHLTFLNYDRNLTEPFELKDIPLEKLAPILRMWRP